jgi:hypothetical protein
MPVCGNRGADPETVIRREQIRVIATPHSRKRYALISA